MRENFLERVLEPPAYGWSRNGELYVPTTREIMSHWLERVNIFKSRKAWLPAAGWWWTLCLLPFAIVFVTRFFSWKLAAVGFVYAMVWHGTVNTVWLHRYCTHRAFAFTHPIYRFIVRNLVIKLVPEEVYVVSHHVHHAFTERPGDPYNALAGRLYCFLAGELHQPIRRDLSHTEYARVVQLLAPSGVTPNSYVQYLKWGSVSHPVRHVLAFVLNWAFWYGAFYLMGGHALAVALFGASFVWALGIRDFNYDAHGGGKNKHWKGIDFNTRDLSINQFFAGTVAGEWHNNHHLFPAGVRSGFLWWQMDAAYWLICLVKLFGGVRAARDYKARFVAQYLNGLPEPEGEPVVIKTP